MVSLKRDTFQPLTFLKLVSFYTFRHQNVVFATFYSYFVTEENEAVVTGFVSACAVDCT